MSIIAIELGAAPTCLTFATPMLWLTASVAQTRCTRSAKGDPGLDKPCSSQTDIPNEAIARGSFAGARNMTRLPALRLLRSSVSVS